MKIRCEECKKYFPSEEIVVKQVPGYPEVVYQCRRCRRELQELEDLIQD